MSESTILKGHILTLQERKEIFILRRDQHREHANLFNILHYCLGFPQVVLTIIITSMADKNSCESNRAAVVLGSIASLLGVATTFFKIKERGFKHHTSANQWADLIVDTELEIHQHTHTEEFERLISEKEKFIRSYEPSFCSSSCLQICCT